MVALSRRRLATLATACAFAFAWTTASLAQQRPKISVSSLTLPVVNPIVWNIMKARGFDAKHGFELDIKAYPSISAFYAAFSTGETEALIGGPSIFQKLFQEGVPLRMFGTGFALSDLVIFARDPNIKSLADLKGKQLAADMGGSQFQWSRSMPMQRASSSARISPSSTPTSLSRAHSWRPTASRPPWSSSRS